jgi:uncharacterized protein YgbK (DUF1537 family)
MLNAKRVLKAELFASLPPEWPEPLMPAIRAAVAASGQTVVVLDDDPTGTQAIDHVAALTQWSAESLVDEFKREEPCFFMLTNSRSLAPGDARILNQKIASTLLLASQAAGRRFVVVSRSDSTLRGHFPLETDSLDQVLGPFDGVLLVPFFETGARHTINDIHYLADGEWLVPVAETQFARDQTFGYHNSNLRAWVEEKSAGRVSPSDVFSISLDTIRRGGPERVRDELRKLADGRVCIANLVNARDLEVFVLGVLLAEAAGKRFIYRTASSFPAVRAGITPRPVLTPSELNLPSTGGGLVVVGSYIPSSSAQLRELIETASTRNVEVNVHAFLESASRAAEITKAAEELNSSMRSGHDAVLYTSREVITAPDPLASLAICRQISDCIVAILERLTARPAFVIAKGGITSSDMLTKALRVHRAEVLGQLLPGIPLWRLGEECRWPGIHYLTFPGNLGGPSALKDAFQKLKTAQGRSR